MIEISTDNGRLDSEVVHQFSFTYLKHPERVMERILK
jgi:hypothetical protein